MNCGIAQGKGNTLYTCGKERQQLLYVNCETSTLLTKTVPVNALTKIIPPIKTVITELR